MDSLSLTATAGVLHTFHIQARDFYSNNIQTLFAAALADYLVDLVDDTGASVAVVSIGDLAANNGVYEVSFTPTISGSYSLIL